MNKGSLLIELIPICLRMAIDLFRGKAILPCMSRSVRLMFSSVSSRPNTISTDKITMLYC
jgi:hypothetical protein